MLLRSRAALIPASEADMLCNLRLKTPVAALAAFFAFGLAKAEVTVNRAGEEPTLRPMVVKSDADELTLEQWKAGKGAAKDRKSLRTRMVRDAAMSAAMRAGLARQSQVINQMLDENGRYLDDVYDFGGIMLSHNVVPPVVRRIERVTEQEADVLRYTALRFRITKQAAFSTRAPTWRTYLTVPVWDDLGSTHQSLLPQNSEEEAAAKQGLREGWAAGEKQANDMFMRGLVRLQNDYLGMLNYHALLKSGMVTLPRVLRKDVPVVGDASTMALDQSTYQIESKPSFNPRMMDWSALIDKAGSSDFFTKTLSPDEEKRVFVAPSLDELEARWKTQ